MKMITQQRTLKSLLLSVAMLLCMNASAKHHQNWQLDSSNSSVSFISIKKSNIAETHTFTEFDGKVDGGTATVTIKTESIESNVDIRNQRMREFLFETGLFPEITIKAEVETALAELEVGQSQIVSLAANLSMHGVSKDINLVARISKLSKTRLLVSSSQPVLIRAKDYNMLEGVVKLSSLVNNLAIAETVPVSFSLVFESE